MVCLHLPCLFSQSMVQNIFSENIAISTSRASKVRARLRLSLRSSMTFPLLLFLSFRMVRMVNQPISSKDCNIENLYLILWFSDSYEGKFKTVFKSTVNDTGSGKVRCPQHVQLWFSFLALSLQSKVVGVSFV